MEREEEPVRTTFPKATLLISVLAAAASFSAGASSLLQYDRAAVMHGEVWRLLTGHLVHFTTLHLAANAGALLLAEWALRRSSARIPFIFWPLSALVVGLTLLVALPGLAIYGGLSGIVCALCALLALQPSSDNGHRLTGTRPLLFLLGAKLLLECTTGRTLFSSSGDLPFVPVPLAHLAGFAAGCAAVATQSLRDRFRRSQVLEHFERIQQGTP